MSEIIAVKSQNENRSRNKVIDPMQTAQEIDNLRNHQHLSAKDFPLKDLDAVKE